jgi:hypothetical protein
MKIMIISLYIASVFGAELGAHILNDDRHPQELRMTNIILSVKHKDRGVRMGHSKADKDESHDRIVQVAAARFRETGVDGVHSLYEIGCTATLRRVDRLDEGRFDIIIVGASEIAGRQHSQKVHQAE